MTKVNQIFYATMMFLYFVLLIMTFSKLYKNNKPSSVLWWRIAIFSLIIISIVFELFIKNSIK